MACLVSSFSNKDLFFQAELWFLLINSIDSRFISKLTLGNGKRVFLMSPIHHHFQKLGYHESKIVVRFWIIGILMAILSLITLKIR